MPDPEPKPPETLRHKSAKWVGLVLVTLAIKLLAGDAPAWTIGLAGLVFLSYGHGWLKWRAWTTDGIAIAWLPVTAVGLYVALYLASFGPVPGIMFQSKYPPPPSQADLLAPFLSIGGRPVRTLDDPRIQFTVSPLWTTERKVTVQAQIREFDGYLRRLGIVLPTALPLFSITTEHQVAWAYSSPANPPIDGRQIPVSMQTMEPFWIRDVYAIYVFDRLLESDPSIDARTVWTLAEYFSASSIDTPPPNLKRERLEGWVAALWELRTKLGQDFTDRALAYGLKAPVERNAVVDAESLGKHLRVYLLAGAMAVKNDWDQYSEVRKILGGYQLLR